MTRRYGMGRVFRRGPAWWIAYYHHGIEHRESVKSEKESDARKLLRQRLGEIAAGRFVGPSEGRLSFEEMAKDLEADYRANDRRSWEKTGRFHVGRLKGFLGGLRAAEITPSKVRAYQAKRREEKMSVATVNREVACLNRMLSIAVELGKLSRKRSFKLLSGERVRQGFPEHEKLYALIAHLPPYLKPVVEFLHLSGWRKGEATSLEWPDVDLAGRVVRLRIEKSKTGEGRLLPLEGRLWELIEAQARNRRPGCSYVFHCNGRKTGDFKKAWKKAAKAAGLAGLLVHDLRRCAARDMSRAGVPQAVSMKLMGHKTDSMHRRYRIVDEEDLREAVERRLEAESEAGALRRAETGEDGLTRALVTLWLLSGMGARAR